jgi:hypothetical protein
MVESTSVERHIRYLLDLLEPHSDTLLHIMTEQELKADFFCLWVSAEGHGGPMLSPETMRRIAALHAELGFDFYGPDDN